MAVDYQLVFQYVEFYKFAHIQQCAADSTVSNKAGMLAELYNFIHRQTETFLDVGKEGMEELLKSINLLNLTRAEYRKMANVSVIKNKNKNQMMEDKTWVSVDDIEKMIRVAYKVSGSST